MKRLVIFLLGLSLLLAACNAPAERNASTATEVLSTATATPVPTVTPTIVPPKTITLCTAALPTSLFPYDGMSPPIKENILRMLSQPGLDSGNGEGEISSVLQKMPSLEDGSLRIEPVAVTGGQQVVDARGEIVVLKAGERVRPSGCRQADCAFVWDGTAALEMDQMVMTFNLHDGLLWSDDTPVTAADSVFSYQAASAAEAVGLKWAEERTADYFPVDPQTVQWAGKPGFTTSDLAQFFWNPLPAHLFDGPFDWAMMREDERLNGSPLSYGPFVLTAWGAAEMRFEPNPTFMQAHPELTPVDIVTIRAIEGGAPEALLALQSGACDSLDSSFGLQNNPALLSGIEGDERFELLVEAGEAWTQLVFGIQPAAYDGYYNPYGGDRPDFFGDPLVRRALASCLDREAMLKAIPEGFGELWQSFVPSQVSQLESGEKLAYDPLEATELLVQVGWRDHDGIPETPLQAYYVANIPAGTQFEVELLIDETGFQQDLADLIRESLMGCGVAVNVTRMPAQALYAPGPDGKIFGRAFDLTLIAWQPLIEPDCGYYQSWRMPSEENQWVGTNISGLRNEAYDQACSEAYLSLSGEKANALYQAERAYLEWLPAIPLLSTGRVMVVPADYCKTERILTEKDFFDQLAFGPWDAACP